MIITGAISFLTKKSDSHTMDLKGGDIMACGTKKPATKKATTKKTTAKKTTKK